MARESLAPAERAATGAAPAARSWSQYSRNAICTYLIDGYAPAALLLGAERKLSNSTIGLYSVAMGGGILAGGLVAHRIGRTWSRDRRSWLALAGASIGVVALTVGPNLPTTLAATALTGLCVAVALSTVQSLIFDLGGPRGLSESSGFGELFGMVAPFLIALGALIGLTWRGGLLVAPVVAGAAYLAARRELPASPPPASSGSNKPEHRFGASAWAGWACGTLLASAEFAIVLWMPQLLRSNTGVSTAVCTAIVSLLLAGMAVGRLLAGRLRLEGNLDALLGGSVLVTLAGFAVLWLTSVPLVAILAVIIMGLAMSVHAPLALARLIAAVPAVPDLAAARAAAGQGLAMLGCPVLLGVLSDAWGFRRAVLVFAATLVLAFLAICVAPVERRR